VHHQVFKNPLPYLAPLIGAASSKRPVPGRELAAMDGTPKLLGQLRHQVRVEHYSIGTRAVDV